MPSPPIESTPDLPQRLHHNAYVCADQEQTRRFYEDVLGLPLIATWIEEMDMDGRAVRYSHTFFGLADGSALAFFNFHDADVQAQLTPNKQPPFVHIALKVSEAAQTAIRARCDAANVPNETIDHGYCRSLYVVDPDAMTVEFACDAEPIDAINAQQKATAHATLKRWMAGDTTPNNDIRHH